MDDTERANILRSIEIWKRIGPELEALHRKEIREADNLKVLECLEDAFNHALTLPPREYSGLVEMQKYFRKLRQ